MMPKADFTELAKADLDEIWLYIAQDNPDAADSLVMLIKDKCQSLATSPVSVRTRQSEYGENLYVFPVRKTYLVFYELSENGITVARVLHGKRDIPAVFEEAFGKQVK